MKRVRPVLVTSLLAAALLAPAGTAHADDEESPVPSGGPVLRHGDLVGSQVHYAITTTQGGVAVTRTVAEQYDQRGRLVEQDVTDTDPSGAVVSWAKAANEYDAKGRLVHQEQVSDWDADGEQPPYTWSVDTTYDKAGNPATRVVALDYDSDGTPESRDVYMIGTDKRSRTVTWSYGVDTDWDDVADGTATRTEVYDVHGNLVHETTTTRGGDGALVSTAELVSTYDPNGRETGFVQTNRGADGSLQMSYVETLTYDRQGRLVESRFDSDDDGDGTVDGVYLNTWVYGQRGQAVKVTVTGPYGGYVETFGYDGQGRLVRDDEVSTYEWGSAVSHRVLTYDTQGRRTSEETVSDWDGDGTAEATYRVDTTYDAQGRTATETASSYDGDTLSSRTVKTWAYPTHTGYTVTTAQDWDGDGSVDSTTVVNRTVS